MTMTGLAKQITKARRLMSCHIADLKDRLRTQKPSPFVTNDRIKFDPMSREATEELVAGLELILTLSLPGNQTEAQKSALRNLAKPLINSKELATVLAALRYWQADVLTPTDSTQPRRGDAHFEDQDPLTLKEVDELCERLNCGGA